MFVYREIQLLYCVQDISLFYGYLVHKFYFMRSPIIQIFISICVLTYKNIKQCVKVEFKKMSSSRHGVLISTNHYITPVLLCLQ